MSDVEETPLSSSPTPPPPPTSTKSKVTSKSSKSSKKVILHLRSDILAKFPSAQPPRKASRSKPAISTTPDPETRPDSTDKNDEKLDTNGTASAMAEKVEDNDATPTTSGAKRKGIPGPKPGAKRAAPVNGVDANGAPKPRGKPGPKKKLKGENEGGSGATAAQTKLGPKANQGAINAGLRALDRSGNPCRRWSKTGFQLKTFTGSFWTMPTWYTVKRPEPETSAEGNSDANGSSDAKPENVSSIIESDNGNSGGATANGTLRANDIPSSPITNGVAVEATAA